MATQDKVFVWRVRPNRFEVHVNYQIGYVDYFDNEEEAIQLARFIDEHGIAGKMIWSSDNGFEPSGA